LIRNKKGGHTLKAVITRNEEADAWQISTYKSTSFAVNVEVMGAWFAEVKTNRPTRWNVLNHKEVVVMVPGATGLLGERIDNYSDSDLLTSEIAGDRITFTKEGVYLTGRKEEGKEMSSMEEAMVAQGLTRQDLDNVAELPAAPRGKSVPTMMHESEQRVFRTSERQQKSLQQHYFDKYGAPTNDLEATALLNTIYSELISPLTPEVAEGIAEYYRIISTRGLPAFHWLVESFHMVSKKARSKQTFPYVVGMLRSWMKFGFGHVPNSEETDVVSFLEEVTEVEVSVNARRVIQNLLGTFGAIKCAICIPELKGMDFSYYVALSLKDVLEKKYGAVESDQEAHS
jgi:hypothetical protein